MRHCVRKRLPVVRRQRASRPSEASPASRFPRPECFAHTMGAVPGGLIGPCIFQTAAYFCRRFEEKPIYTCDGKSERARLILSNTIA